jgi:uncharacterized protein (DUF488 family)
MTIYSIGYQKLTIARLIEVMTDRGVNLLIDLRCKPYGRLKDFNRNALVKIFGNRYSWQGETLGGFCGPVAKEAIESLSKLSGSVLIMCMEHDPLKCHRYQDIAKRLLEDYTIDVIHIMDDREYRTSDLMKEESHG